LLRRAQAGEDSALNALWERYAPALRRWATGRLPRDCRDLLGTDDLVHDTFLSTLRSIKGFDPHRDGALHAYLRRALMHRLVDEVRRVRRHPHEPGQSESQLVDHGASPLEEAIGRETLEKYEAALGRLREEDRELVIARVEMGLSYDLIAKALDKPSADAARVAIGRALVRLAGEMDHEQR
jgi:RNA polymerase sigma-70 factor (ECF subfamily)